MKQISTNILIFLYALLATKVYSQNNLEQNEGLVKFDIDVEKKTYAYSFKTPDFFITKKESGHFEPNPPGEDALVVEGSYSYVGPDGLSYVVTYTADKNGYHPKVEFPARRAQGAGGGGGGFGGGFGGGGAPGAGVGGYAAPIGPSTTRIGPGAPGGKGIDSALLCSLAGSGCL